MSQKQSEIDIPWESTVHPCYEFKILTKEKKVQFLCDKKVSKAFTLSSFEKACNTSSPDDIGTILMFCRKNGIELTKKVFRLREVSDDG
jgi:hypothetical protein